MKLYLFYAFLNENNFISLVTCMPCCCGFVLNIIYIKYMAIQWNNRHLQDCW